METVERIASERLPRMRCRRVSTAIAFGVATAFSAAVERYTATRAITPYQQHEQRLVLQPADEGTERLDGLWIGRMKVTETKQRGAVAL